MKIKPAILIIENSIAVTGALKSITRAAFALRDFFDFTFIIPQKSKSRFWLESKTFLSIHEFPLRELSRRVKDLVIYAPFLVMNSIKLVRLLRANSISLIHSNDLYNLLPVAIRLFGKMPPYICHIRFLPDRFPPLLLRFWLGLHFKYAARIVVVSQSVKRLLPVNPKIEVVYCSIPGEERHPREVARTIAPGNYTFLYMANVIKGKGHAFALQAFAMVHGKLPGWRLRLVGGDMGLGKNKHYQEDLMSMASALEIDSKIEWVPFTDDVELEYKRADIVLNFSESESFSMTCLEALYFGRPLIATDCGGPAEIIDHLVTGILVPNRNVAAMAHAMAELANDVDLRIKMSDRAPIVVREKFSKEQTSDRLQEIYESVLGATKENT